MSGGLEMLLDPVGTIIHGSRKDKKATPAPAPTPEPVAPMPDVEAANAAAKRRAAAGRARSGRLSTILTDGGRAGVRIVRSEEHTSELQSLMRTSYAVFCLKKKTNKEHVRPDQEDKSQRRDSKYG